MAIPVADVHLGPAILEYLRFWEREKWDQHRRLCGEHSADLDYAWLCHEWLDLTQPYKCSVGFGGNGDVFVEQGKNAWYIRYKEIQNARRVLEMGNV